MIHICNLLLTRRCNLKCSYCSLTRNYKNKPLEYPDMNYYLENEMTTNYVKEILRRLKLHNKNIFIVCYGGEPTLRDDLSEIVNYMNKEYINYTIITNNTDKIQPKIEKLLKETDYIQGLTSSIDPLINTNEPEGDRYKKCISGFNNLIKYKGKVKDLVGEATIDSNNVDYMYDLVCMLHENNINTDITFIDIRKSNYYDFSNITDEGLLVKPTWKLKNQLQKIIDEKLDVHMAKELLPRIFNILPANMDCGIDKNIHNITIDADGTVRLCLRVRAVNTPKLKLTDYMTEDGKIKSILKQNIIIDKNKYCLGCNHTCYIMSDILQKNENRVNDLIHSNKRK